MCGEYITILLSMAVILGSPPRVRGIPEKAGEVVMKIRITPACAGNTELDVLDKALAEDHPRVCGEYAWGKYAAHAPQGSPPRVRGIPGRKRP